MKLNDFSIQLVKYCNQKVPASIISIPTKRPEAKCDKPTKFVIPPTLKQLEKQKQQVEIVKVEREYKISRKDCGFKALQEEIDKLSN